ncbi:MAG: hypothetical protein ACLUIQ_05500 [Dialister invisus]
MISGPNVGIYGTGVQYETTNPGGIVSVKSKVAPDKGVFDYTQTISGRGLLVNILTGDSVLAIRRNGVSAL